MGKPSPAFFREAARELLGAITHTEGRVRRPRLASIAMIGDDLWSRFEAEGTTDPGVGRAYRRAILEPNGARSGDEMVLEFLGRSQSTATYLRTRGLPSSVPAEAQSRT